MNRTRLHRWWLLNAAWGCVLIAWESILLALGLHGAWLLMPTVPLTVVQFIGWRKTRPGQPRPDYARIALLEHELLGIEPGPGTFAAAAVALQAGLASVNQARQPQRPCPHEAGQWVWSERLGRLWRCTECPKATTR